MSVPCDMLLHPELLTNEQLIYIMQERHLRIPNIEVMRRDELLDIFHHYCVPYPQRKNRDSGRGKMLNKTRPASPEPAIKHHATSSQWTKHTNPNCNRAKPPPDLLSGHMKRIKLNVTENTVIATKNQNNVHNVKRKMSIDAMTPAIECPPIKKERKLITWP